MSTTAVPPAATPAPVVGALLAALPAGRVLDDPDVLASYAHDDAEWAPHAVPAAVARPRTAEEAQAVVRACLEHARRWCRAVRAPACRAGRTPARAPWCSPPST